MGILEKTMEQMPTMFTSFEFNEKAVKNGYSKRLLKHKGLNSFISKYADNGSKYSKTWTKKSVLIVNEPTETSTMTVENAIDLLKSKGYKIMKPINEWKEC